MPPPTPNPKTYHARRRKKDATITEDEEHVASEDEPPIVSFDTPSHTSDSQATPRAKSRRSEASNNVHPLTNPHKRRPSQKATVRGLSADARVEHLLLAARKIGRHRAGIMSGMVQHMEELERERKREESTTTAVATTPRTPKRSMSHVVYPPEGGYVYMNGQVRPAPGMQPVPLFFPAYPHHLLQTPSSSTTAPSVTPSTQKPKQDAKTNNPPTPLDSLLSAARSMMHEGIDAEVDEDEYVDVVGGSPGPANTVGTRTRNIRPRDTFGSPVPKRRKVLPGTGKPPTSHDLTSQATNSMSASSVITGGGTNVGAGRVRSALDVLADQAAAFSTQEQSGVPSQPQTQTEGKGKEREDARPQDSSSSIPKPRGRTMSRKGQSEADTPSPVAPTSRSRTPRSDLGDNVFGSMPATAAGGSTSDVAVDPGGVTSTPNPSSSQTLDSALISEEDQGTENNDTQSPRLPGTPPLPTDESADATPRQGSHAQGMLSEDGVRAPTAQPSLVPLSVSPVLENERREASPLQQHSETTPPGGENSVNSGSGTTTSIAQARNKELVRVAEQDASAQTPPAKRQRSPYVKWSKEEDDLLAQVCSFAISLAQGVLTKGRSQAVAKYGQKWDLVQKALPSRGYHQVRQRWLRKLGMFPSWFLTVYLPETVMFAGVFDSKPDLSSYQTAAFPSSSRGDGGEPRGNPKLGLAPLSSERAFPGLMRRSPSMPS